MMEMRVSLSAGDKCLPASAAAAAATPALLMLQHLKPAKDLED